MMLIEKLTNAKGQVSLGLSNANKMVAIVISSSKRTPSTTKRHSWRGLLDAVVDTLETTRRPMSGAEIVRAIIRKKAWPGAVSRGPRAAKFRTDMERAIWCQVKRDKASRVKKLPTCRYDLG